MLTPTAASQEMPARVTGAVIKTLEVLLVLCLFSMIVMIFGNVVLRYVFGSGIVLSEELSRFAFIWMTFIGAVLAAREGLHVGVDSLVVALPISYQRVCIALSEILIIGCCLVFFWGTWRQHEVHATTTAPASGLPMIWVFGVGYVTSIGIILVCLMRLLRLVQGEQLNVIAEKQGDVA